MFDLVIVESPYAGDIEANVAYARRCVKDCMLRGEAAMASHLIYTQEGITDDTIPEERSMGIEAGLAWLQAASRSIVYVDLGISPGMQFGIDRARALGKPVEYRSLAPEARLDPSTGRRLVSDRDARMTIEL